MPPKKYIFARLSAFALAGLLLGVMAETASSQVNQPGNWYQNNPVPLEFNNNLYRDSFDRYYRRYRDGFYDHGYDSRYFPGTTSSIRGYHPPPGRNVYPGDPYYRPPVRSSGTAIFLRPGVANDPRTRVINRANERWR